MLVSVNLPAGVVAKGTDGESKGRYCDASLVRWNPLLQPIGGWSQRVADQTAFDGVARCLLTWRDNSQDRWIGVGTSQGLFVMNEGGDVADITPSGFTTGTDDAVASIGYGAGVYGAGTYGTPRPDTGSKNPVTVWTLDTWGEYLVGVSSDDGVLVQWQLDTMADAAAITDAPTGCGSLVVTQERILMALAPEGNNRRIDWSNREDNTDWTPTDINQAGSFELQTTGAIQCGRRVTGGTLILTTNDVWLATYIGVPGVYAFNRQAGGGGVISRQGVAVNGAQAVWIGSGSFWLFDGYVRPLECSVLDRVFSDFNTGQASKVTAVHLADFGEVWWFYPSAASLENDRYVVWDYRKNTWSIGALARTCGTDKGAFDFPLMVDPAGYVFEHERGSSYDGAQPYAETYPMRIGMGDRMAEVQRLIPDEKTQGGVEVTFYAQTWPNDTPTTYGPYAMSSPTDVLFQAGQAKMRFTFQNGPEDRVGEFRLDVRPGDPLVI